MAVNGKTVHRTSTTVQTTDATVTVVQGYTLPDDCVAMVKAIVLAREESTGDVANYYIVRTYERDSGGAAATVGGQGNLHVVEQDTSWNATTTTSGNDLRITVQGAASHTIEWWCHLEVYILEAN